MRIALAEDDRVLRATLVRGLREAGHAVDAAGTGGQILELTAANTYDAIILDVMLPAPDGIAVCRALREAGNRVPVLMLTALDGVDSRITGLDAGADDYLTKPFDFGELLARLRAIVRRHGERLPAVLAVADVSIDTRRRRVTRAGREVPLTAREYDFLLHLAVNAGRVVSRAELLAQVWHDPQGSYSNIIDVYASRLRKKLEDDGPQQLLTTIRGTGFLLAAVGVAPPGTDGGGASAPGGTGSPRAGQATGD